MNIWTEFAKSYDEVIPNLFCYKTMTGRALELLGPCRRILDAGCGTGLLSKPLASGGHDVVSFDNNPHMLANALNLRSQHQGPNWEVFEWDVEKDPPVEGSFDGILMNNVLFYVRDPDAVFSWVTKRLAVGGRLILTGPWQRPDLALVMRSSIEEWESHGLWDEELRTSFARFSEVSRKLVTQADEMQTFFRAHELVERLREEFPLKVLWSSETDYFGQNYFVAVQRGLDL